MYNSPTDDNIEHLRKLLRSRGRNDLSDLLIFSYSNIEESSSYGRNALFSRASTFEVFSPIAMYEKLRKLNEKDKSEIFHAVIELIPAREYGIDIENISFRLDVDLLSDKTIKCSNLQNISFDYIGEQITKCEEKLLSRDFDGAITNARTLIESVCLFILEENNIQFEYDGSLKKLYKEVNKALKMDPAQYDEDNLRQILSGIISIVSGLAGLRNSLSDAHGKTSRKYYKPTERHAVLAINMAKAISEYIYSSWDYQKMISDK